MKKNMTVLAALFCGAASVALADTANITFNTPEGADKVMSESILSSDTLDIALSSAKLVNQATDDPLTLIGSSDSSAAVYAAGEFAPNLLLKGDGAAKWTLSFTVTNNSAGDVLFDSLDLSVTACNSAGKYQGGSRNVSFTLASESGDLGNVSMAVANTPGGTDMTLSFGSGLTLSQGESVVLSLTAASSSSSQTYVTMSGMSLSYTPVASPAVPEPATATLSLLALAGLCARRRRK